MSRKSLPFIQQLYCIDKIPPDNLMFTYLYLSLNEHFNKGIYRYKVSNISNKYPKQYIPIIKVSGGLSKMNGPST